MGHRSHHYPNLRALLTGLIRRDPAQESAAISPTLSNEAVEQYQRDGFYFPIRVMSAEVAAGYRAQLEAYEAASGGPIASNMRHKVHLLFTWASELVRHSEILDVVEDVLGPDLLCWNTNFFIKEPESAGFVTFHQDSTYWGLDSPDVMTVWLALSDAGADSGPMKFMPGSHKQPQLDHRDTFDEENLLTRGQEVEVDVDETKAATVALRAGEVSLHHVLLVHGSIPNASLDRRIGFAIRYIPTYVRQLKIRTSATLVRGEDAYHNFDLEPEPRADLDGAAMAAHAEAMERQVAALLDDTEQTEMKR